MNANSKLSYAIAAILSGSSMGIVHAATATATDTSDSDSIQEITVTAQRRTESIQDVPITIQAISGDSLKQLNVQTFDDLIKYTPNVTFSGNGPGTGNIFIRGLSSGGSGNQSQSTTAPFPNVAVYLDDESMQFPARNADVYMVDMERVEILEGPQGTLFGGGAQAGAIRYITNKPKLDVTEGDVNASYGITADGGNPNSAVNATINLPIIPEHLAIRGTIYSDSRGGYIDNVPGTLAQTVPTATPTPVTSNNALVENDTNSVNYTGLRLSLLYQINDDWNALLMQSYQNMDSEGYFNDYPVASDGQTLAPYKITAFSPAYDHDKYEATSWTVNGKVDDWKMVYTGSYMIRHIEQQADYSNYLLSGGGGGGGGQYYDCTGGAFALGKKTKPTTCYAPVGSWRDTVQNEHQSHELRVSSPEDFEVFGHGLRGIAGLYWEEFQIQDQMNFNYLAIPQCTPEALTTALAGGPDCVAATGPLPGTPAVDPTTRSSTTAFGEDAQRGYIQRAFFASADFDIIPKVLTFTAGTRLFHYNEFETGSEFYTSSASVDKPNGTAPNGFGIDLHKQESGSRSRGNLTWHVTPDTMVYYTYSQGFRPGGFNRTSSAGGVISQAAVAPYTAGDKTTRQYLKPVGFDSDNLINNEIGAKTEFLDHKLQLNGSLYKMKWENVQIPLFDPSQLGNTTFVTNGPTYEVKGVELQIVARPIPQLSIQGSSSWNSTNQISAPCLSSSGTASGANNPTPKGQCITVVNSATFNNPYGQLDTSPAFSPPLEFNLRARWDQPVFDYKTFISVGANHIASQRNEPASFPSGNLPTSAGGCLVNGVPNTTLCQYTMPGYTTYDAAIGVSKDQWTAQITGNNLTNSDASTYTSSNQFIKTEVPLRPRVLTLTFGYKF
jgi:outer membrane receptor protein involved in Fe transport